MQDTIFSYDKIEDYNLLKQIFIKANENFLKNELELIITNTSETSLCGALKSHMEKQIQHNRFDGYYIDIEYNRNNGKIKTIIDKECKVLSVKCDYILHSRGNHVKQDNLLALEMKKAYRRKKEKNADRNRLIALTKSTYNTDIWSYDGMTFPAHVCQYIIGIYYEVDYRKGEILLEFYRQGKLEEAKVIKLPIAMRNRWEI